MSELDHRAKNVLAVAQAILRLTRAETLPDFIAAVEGRIRALARVHTQVAENRWDGRRAPHSSATSGLETFGDREGRATVEGPRRLGFSGGRAGDRHPAARARDQRRQAWRAVHARGQRRCSAGGSTRRATFISPGRSGTARSCPLRRGAASARR